MIKDLVKYLLRSVRRQILRRILNLRRQGTYSAEGGVVVLCGYLGQLAKVRDALSSEVVVLIDERDQKELADRESDNEVEPDVTRVSRVPINKRVSCGKHFVRNHLTGLWIKVKIRTVDNFQGEEADVSTGMFTEGGTSIIPSGYYTFFGEELRKWSSGVFKHGRTRVCQHRIFQGTSRQSMSVAY